MILLCLRNLKLSIVMSNDFPIFVSWRRSWIDTFRFEFFLNASYVFTCWVHITLCLLVFTVAP
jgi:hypothetical protein